MCDTRKESGDVWSKIGGMSLTQYFPEHLTSRINPSMAQPGKCLVPNCNQMLTQQQIAAGQYMCQHCFETLTTSGPHHNCLSCGQPLNRHLVQSQARMPRELKFKFHPGQCLDYHWALAGRVLGTSHQNMVYAEQEYHQNPMITFETGQQNRLPEELNSNILRLPFTKIN